MVVSTVTYNGTPCFYPYDLGVHVSDQKLITVKTVRSGVVLKRY